MSEKQRTWLYAWERNGTRRPLPPLWVAQRDYGFQPVKRPRYVPEGFCEWCGKPLTGRQTSCCSDACRRKFNLAITWNARGGYAKHIMRRDNFTCQDTGEFHALKNEYGIYVPTSDGQLEIHHKKPVCEGGDDSPDNLVTLSHDAHMRRPEHHRKRDGETKQQGQPN